MSTQDELHDENIDELMSLLKMAQQHPEYISIGVDQIAQVLLYKTVERLTDQLREAVAFARRVDPGGNWGRDGNNCGMWSAAVSEAIDLLEVIE